MFRFEHSSGLRESLESGDVLWLGNFSEDKGTYQFAGADDGMCAGYTKQHQYNAFGIKMVGDLFGRDNVLLEEAYDPATEQLGVYQHRGVYVKAEVFMGVLGVSQ